MIASTVYPALKNHAPLAALVGTRIYRDFAGDAPLAPYVVWSILTSVPSQGIARLPAYADRYSVAVYAYSSDRAQSDAVTTAARNAMEAIGKLSGGVQSLGYDSETALYGYTFTVDVFQNR